VDDVNLLEGKTAIKKTTEASKAVGPEKESKCEVSTCKCLITRTLGQLIIF
jgi:hypothetical protein